jgi:flagellar FliL protein
MDTKQATIFLNGKSKTPLASTPYFLRQFDKFDKNLSDFSLTWNWAAFFFGPFYLIYRKLYLAGFITLLLMPAYLITSIILGITANFFIYRSFLESVTRVQIAYPSDEERQNEFLAMKGGVNKRLPAILATVVIIILAAIILFTAASVITYNVLNKDTDTDTQTAQPQYSMFSSLPVIRATTKDSTPYSVVVELILGYDLNDTAAATELTSRLVELQDFIRSYFSSKYNVDLQPDKEEQLKQELIEQFNSRLNVAKIRTIEFKQLITMEM